MKHKILFAVGVIVALAAVTVLTGCQKDEREVIVVDNDLSKNGTANCYVVSMAGNYCFNAAVKGGSTESVGKPSAAAVLWESFGTDEVPVPGDIVSSVSYSNGKVYFTSGRDGNAVIAVKDPSNVILWSWHIWVCKGFDPVATAQVYNNGAGTMMDRNLGATSVTPGDLCASGLLYQWGRKDPFLGCDSTAYVLEKNVKQVASTGAWESATPSYIVTGTIEYVTRHPMQFITYNENNRDWYYTGDKSTDDTRWQASDQPKGMYDPCPAGWRVPDGGSGGVWATALGSDEQTRTGPWVPEKQGMNFGSGAGEGNVLGNYPTVWYPAVACIDIDGKLYRMDKELKKELNGWYGWWSCTPAQGQPYSYCFLNSLPALRPDVHVVAPRFTYGRACAFSVRCVQEQ